LRISNQVIDNARFNINGKDVLNVVGTNDWEGEETICAISKGDVLSITGRAAHPAHDGQYADYKAYFFPVKYTITQNAVSVINKLTPYAGKFIGQPDYAATETINRITASGGQWTVDRDGYVRCSGVAIGSSQIGLQVYINSQRITGSYVYPVAQFDNVVIHPVSKGDVVLINIIGTMTSIGCYFIPPKTVPPLFVEGADLQSSGDIGKVNIDPEDKTMSVNGEIGTGTNGIQYSLNRPDLWPVKTEINFGNNLIGQRFTGNITAAAQTLVYIKLFDVNINTFRIINQGGWFTNPGFNKIPVSIQSGTVNNDPSVVEKCWALIQLRSADSTVFFNSWANDRSDKDYPYDVWVTYNK
jgi:hypothetical protein